MAREQIDQQGNNSQGSLMKPPRWRQTARGRVCKEGVTAAVRCHQLMGGQQELRPGGVWNMSNGQDPGAGRGQLSGGDTDLVESHSLSGLF